MHHSVRNSSGEPSYISWAYYQNVVRTKVNDCNIIIHFITLHLQQGNFAIISGILDLMLFEQMCH